MVLIHVAVMRLFLKDRYRTELGDIFLRMKAQHSHIFKDMGVYLDLDNDEPQAYFTGWLTKRINETINKIEKCLQKSSKES